MKIMSVAGARPNFMKLAALAKAIDVYNARENTKIKNVILHTGQHYDEKMSEYFFKELNIPEPDINLEVGSGTHASQTANIMKAFEPVLLREAPDFLLVIGDVNSTIACSLVASKIEYAKDQHRIRPVIVHVEAGLRSFDRNMPEEINRILTDSLSDLLFITEESAEENLINEGIAQDKIIFAGNVMIDTLQHHLHRAKKSSIKKSLGINYPYGLVTLHRPSNVDTEKSLAPLIDVLLIISKERRLVFPVHPRCLNSLQRFNLLKKLDQCEDVILVDPLPYLDFLNLMQSADFVVTDSGGIQEETTFLNIPCVTLRENTERPITVNLGSNYLIGTSPKKIFSAVNLILSGKGKRAEIPKYWDGRSGERIINEIAKYWLKMANSEFKSQVHNL